MMEPKRGGVEADLVASFQLVEAIAASLDGFCCACSPSPSLPTHGKTELALKGQKWKQAAKCLSCSLVPCRHHERIRNWRQTTIENLWQLVVLRCSS